MFLEPDGGFVGHLLRQRTEDGGPAFDVFTLDWRSSNLLFGAAGEGLQGPGCPDDPINDYRIDRAAEQDLPAGLAAVARRASGRPHRAGGPLHGRRHGGPGPRRPEHRPDRRSPAAAARPHRAGHGGPVLPAGRGRLAQGRGQRRRRPGERGHRVPLAPPRVRGPRRPVPLAARLRGDVRDLAGGAVLARLPGRVLRSAVVPLRRRLPGRRHDGDPRRRGRAGPRRPLRRHAGGALPAHHRELPAGLGGPLGSFAPHERL